MNKLLSLEGFLNLSFNVIRKIEHSLSPLGFERCERYDDIDEFLDEVVENIDEGNTVILATENEEYNQVKKQLLRTFSLKKDLNKDIQDTILESRNGLTSVNDLDGHCLAPLEADIYVTNDGLYSGFCVEFSNGARMIYVPLDEERFDDILPYLKREIAQDSSDLVASFTEADMPEEKSKFRHRGKDDDDVDEAFVNGIFAAMVKKEEENGGLEEKKEEEPDYYEADAFSRIKNSLENISSFSESELATLDSEITEMEEPEEPAAQDGADMQEEEAPGYSETDSFVDKMLFSESSGEESENEEKAEEPLKPVKHDSTGEEKRIDPDEFLLKLKNGERLVIDDNADEADLKGFEEALSAAEKAADVLNKHSKKVSFIGAEASPFLLAMSDEINGLSDCFRVCDVELEGNTDKLEKQVVLAKKTKLAIKENGTQLAAAISPVIKEDRDGKDIYYVYIVIHDGSSAKAKKVSTATKQGVESLIPHAFAVMFGLVERKVESIAMLEDDSVTYYDSDDEKKKRILTISLCTLAAVVAIFSAVVMVVSYFNKTPEILITTQPTANPSESQGPSATGTTVPDVTPGQIISDPKYNYPAEPTASDVSVVPTSTPFASTKGKFTFTVYGYGHGVGMSQTGADYYGDIGKSYLEILAIYYYGATLVLGDTTPETVKYGGTDYTLRDYLATAVESEMGGKYNVEALKAQTVAVYTFAKYYHFDVPSTLHAFGKKPSKAVYDAVDIVIGQYMIYNGEVIRPYFHATSAGKTTSYTNVFGTDTIPYLSGGRPSYGDVNAKGYCTTVTYSSDELSALIYSKTGMKLEGDPANWLKILSHDGCIDENTGYVSKIQVGGQTYTGNEFRMKVLGGAIRSHCFSYIYTPDA